MSEHNRVIRKAQHFLRTLADLEAWQEYSYNNWGESSVARGYRAAAVRLEALLEPEEADE